MRRLLTVSVLLFSLLAGTATAQQFSSLEERMTEAEFKAAGLDKLSPEELAALNTWLSGRVGAPGSAGGSTGGPGAASAVDDRRGFLDSDEDGGPIISSIEGEFRGWEGKGTRFTLANGQVWEISDSTPPFVVKVMNPKVIIEPGLFSAWFLRIDGYNSSAKVRRIR